MEVTQKPCPIRKSRAEGLTLLAKVCIIKIKKAPSIDGCPRNYGEIIALLSRVEAVISFYYVAGKPAV